MSLTVYSWWSLLCAISVLNVLLWAHAAAALPRRAGSLPPEAYALRRLQLLLAAGYVFGCAFRSVLPVYDIPRQALFEHGLASAFIGRSVATVAELCFAAQWALILREAAIALRLPLARRAALQIVPLIALAELCSWYAVLTTSNLGHVVEESLWGLCALIVLGCLLALRQRSRGRERVLLGVWCAAMAAYARDMFAVDVPMYWQRWLHDEAGQRAYLGLAQGVADAWGRRVVTDAWNDWHSEMLWMSLYFSVGVWISVMLVHAPLLGRRHGEPAPTPSWRPRC